VNLKNATSYSDVLSIGLAALSHQAPGDCLLTTPYYRSGRKQCVLDIEIGVALFGFCKLSFDIFLIIFLPNKA
jgi:hypothetical protein